MIVVRARDKREWHLFIFSLLLRSFIVVMLRYLTLALVTGMMEIYGIIIGFLRYFIVYFIKENNELCTWCTDTIAICGSAVNGSSAPLICILIAVIDVVLHWNLYCRNALWNAKYTFLWFVRKKRCETQTRSANDVFWCVYRAFALWLTTSSPVVIWIKINVFTSKRRTASS